MFEDFVFLHSKSASGRSAGLPDISGKVTKTGEGKYSLYCSFSKQLTKVYKSTDKGFRLALKKDGFYLVFIQDGYRISDSGANTVRGSFAAVIRENETNAKAMKEIAGKKFKGLIQEHDVIKLVF